MPEATTATIKTERTRTRTAMHEAISTVENLLDSLDSGELGAGGIVLEPVEDDDTLVTRIETMRTAAAK
jgi:hypothetical protein